jgi:inorganic pyrophosphatase
MIPDAVVAAVIPVACVTALIFAVYLWKRVAAIQVSGGQAVLRSQNGREYLLEEGEGSGEEEVGGVGLRVVSVLRLGDHLLLVTLQVVAKAADIQKCIEDGAIAFLATEYYYLSFFMVGGGTCVIHDSAKSVALHRQSLTLSGFVGYHVRGHLLPAEHCDARGGPHQG